MRDIRQHHAAMNASNLIRQNERDLLQETPCHVAPDIDTVFVVRICQRPDISPEVFPSAVVLQQLLKAEVILPFDTRPVFRHVNG